MRNVNFHNFSKEDFTWTWDSEAVTIKAGETKRMPAYLADHFAKHLIDRELTKAGVADTGLQQHRDELMDKCKGEEIELAGSVNAELDALNADTDSDLACPTCEFEAKNKAGLKAHMRSHENAETTEEDFAGLKKDEDAS